MYGLTLRDISPQHPLSLKRLSNSCNGSMRASTGTVPLMRVKLTLAFQDISRLALTFLMTYGASQPPWYTPCGIKLELPQARLCERARVFACVCERVCV